ncbi:MAG: tyrosine-type recombinase/integrase [Candidatus Bathyarchaeia archaeon]
MSLKWLETYCSPSTVRAYKWGLNEFFKVLGFKASLEENAKAYLSQKRNYEEDLKAYFISLKGKPPKSVDICLTAVKMFLMENGVELPALFWRRLKGRRKGSRALMLDKVPSNAELRRILSHMDAKGRSLFLVLASSGMRIGEALKLKVEDVDLTADPPRINVNGEYTKTGNPRVAFISSEAKESLEEWLKIRNEALNSAIGRSAKYGKKAEDKRIWPFEANTAYFIWRNAIAKSGFAKRFQYNNSVERFTVHPHVLRKFFRTRMATVIPVDVVEALMGHEGYLTEVYRRYSLEDLAKFYKQGEHTLLVFAGEEVSKLRAEVEERNRQLQQIIDGLVAENMRLKTQIQEMQKSFWEKINEVSELMRNEEKYRESVDKAIRLLQEEIERLKTSN